MEINKLTFNKLKKMSKDVNNDFEKISIAFLGDTATQLLCQALKGYGALRKYNFDIFEAEYDSIENTIFDENSKLYSEDHDYCILYMSSEKLYDSFLNMTMEERILFAENYIKYIKNNWDIISKRSQSKIIQFNFIEINDSVFGNYTNKVKSSFLYQIRKLNLMIMDLVCEYKNVFILDISSIQNIYGRCNTFDDKYYYSARLALSIETIPAVAKNVTDIICATKGKIKKCVIVDLDNTLWGGVIGDDGIDNIQVGELGSGRVFTDLQNYLKELKKRGIILAVCSKNNEKTAKEPFIKHPDMVLKLEDISIFVANWENKADNIINIQKTLNIGMDSIVFLDDNVFEREMVRKIIPDIMVPELPEDPGEYVKYLRELNIFETASYSKEDSERTKQYQTEIKRKKSEELYTSIDEYLKSLHMVSKVYEFTKFNYPRISQLSQRSNQFNLRTIRYTEKEIQQIRESDKYITLSFELGDKFGNYGLISSVILEKKDKETLFIDTWFMSCRVLKRSMEEFIVNTIMQEAKERGFLRVIGEYIPTKKNSMVKNIYAEMGFEKIKENLFESHVHNYKNKITYIEMEN